MLAIIVGVVIKILFLVLLLLSGVWCWVRWKHRELIRHASKIPITTIKPYPILGHIPFMFTDWDDVSKKIMVECEATLCQGRNFSCLWVGPMPLVVALGKDDIQKILSCSGALSKTDDMGYMKIFVGNGLLTAPTEVWKISRRHINPLFHQRNVEHLIPIFNSNSRELVKNLSERVGGKDFNIMEYVLITALKSICSLIFGTEIKLDMKKEEMEGVLLSVERSFSIFTKRMVQPWLRPKCLFDIFYGKEVKHLNNLLENFTRTPLKESLTKTRSKNKYDKDSITSNIIEDNGSTLKSLVEVSHFLQENFTNFTVEDLKNEMKTLYFTGTDSIASTVSTCLLAMAQYPHIQKKIYDEIRSLGEEENDVTFEDLNRMPYLDQVFKEAIRWSTLVPFIGRKTTEDLVLSSLFIPAGSTVMIGIAGVHMDPKNYSNPHEFNPDNFLPENVAARGQFSYIPFSRGPRNCIGYTYATALIKIILINILRKYKVYSDMDMHKMKRRLKVTYTSAEGYNIRLEYRKSEQSEK